MLEIHIKLVPLFPPEEKWDLASQIRRSSKSVGANIAEGSGRHYYMDNVRFCYNARGSLEETLDHLQTAYDLHYCTEELYRSLRTQIMEVRKILNSYISWLKTCKIGEKEPGAYLSVHEIPLEYETREE